MRELAQAYLAQGKTVRAAALMLNLIETEPTPENLELLAARSELTLTMRQFRGMVQQWQEEALR